MNYISYHIVSWGGGSGTVMKQVSAPLLLPKQFLHVGDKRASTRLEEGVEESTLLY